MISKSYRFHGLGSLRFVYNKGKTVRDSQISLRYVINNRRQLHRVAVVVSKKVSKSAVVRNRIRRRIYELLREQQASINQPYDLVFSVFSDQVATMPASELAKRISKLLKNAGVI